MASGVCAQHGEHWLLISSRPKHMCYLWRQELFKCGRSPQHACMLLVENWSVENRRWYGDGECQDFNGGENQSSVGTLHFIIHLFDGLFTVVDLDFLFGFGFLHSVHTLLRQICWNFDKVNLYVLIGCILKNLMLLRKTQNGFDLWNRTKIKYKTAIVSNDTEIILLPSHTPAELACCIRKMNNHVPKTVLICETGLK
jgi:hypothetical protein